MKKIKLLGIITCLTTLMACNPQPQEKETSSKNEVIENIMARRSIRKYKAEAVAKATMDTILMCGINAPNGMNKQSWEIRVIDNPQTITQLQEMMVAANPDAKPESVKGCFRNAPTLIIIANDPSYDCSPIDCGLLSENIMLSGWSLGVGSVCLGSPIRFIKNSPEALALLGFSEGYTPIICIGMGYATESPEAKPRDLNKVKYLD